MLNNIIILDFEVNDWPCEDRCRSKGDCPMSQDGPITNYCEYDWLECGEQNGYNHFKGRCDKTCGFCISKFVENS